MQMLKPVMQSEETVETSSIGVIAMLLYIGNAALCLGVLIASAVALSTIDHTFAPDILYEHEDRENGHKYREIGWILLSIGIAEVIIQGVLAIMCKLYRESYIEEYFITFASISAVISALFALALIFGGIASVANARNLQHEYLDQYDCAAIDDDLPNDDNDIDFEIAQKLCHYLEKLRRCQIASAILAFVGDGGFALLIIIMVVSIIKKMREFDYQTIDNDL